MLWWRKSIEEEETKYFQSDLLHWKSEDSILLLDSIRDRRHRHPYFYRIVVLNDEDCNHFSHDTVFLVCRRPSRCNSNRSRWPPSTSWNISDSNKTGHQPRAQHWSRKEVWRKEKPSIWNQEQRIAFGFTVSHRMEPRELPEMIWLSILNRSDVRRKPKSPAVSFSRWNIVLDRTDRVAFALGAESLLGLSFIF